MGLRRGFKKEAEATAEEVRTELGLQSMDRLDPMVLAESLCIKVVSLASLGDEAAGAVAYFTTSDPGAFSAATVFDGNRRLIVHNDDHAPGRQASNISHELAHGLLLHKPTPALDDRGCRLWDPVVEEEADWLAGCLLIPAAAALEAARRGLSVAELAAHFGVSEKMADYRLNITGARVIALRSQRYRATRS